MVYVVTLGWLLVNIIFAIILHDAGVYLIVAYTVSGHLLVGREHILRVGVVSLDGHHRQ
jgi:hypothetical protein